MKVQICTCLLLLFAAGICSLPAQVDDSSEAVEISSSLSDANITNADLAEFCNWSFSYVISGSVQFDRKAIDDAITAFFNSLCEL